MVDILRWITIFVCVFNVGVMLAFYQRVGQLLVPHLQVRLLMLANAISLCGIAVSIHQLLGHSVTFRSVLLGTAAVVQFVALIGIHHWYGTRAGRVYIDCVKHGGTAGKG